MSRLIVSLIMAVALIAALAACGGEEEAAPTATTAVATATPVPAATLVPPTATPVPAATAMPEPTLEATEEAPPTATPVPTAVAPAVAIATAMPEPTPIPPTATPVPEPTPETPPQMTEEEMLAQYAASVAGGPGAIFVGDPANQAAYAQLLGPPPHEGLMFQLPEALYTQLSQAGLFGSPELGIPGHQFIYTSDYYQGLIEKANLLDPTELVSSGEEIEIQHVCLDRNLPTCVLIQTYLAPNIALRTNGQVKLSVTSYLELYVSGNDSLNLVGEGTVDMANIYTGYVSGALPPVEVKSLWGLAPDWETSFLSQGDMAPAMDALMSDATYGGFPYNRNWFAGADQWFFSNEPIQSLEDFQGKEIRTHAAALTALIEGLGGEAVDIGLGTQYLAIQNGTVDVGTTGALIAVSDKIYEVADYMAGPVIGFGYTDNIINGDVWDGIPEDLQQIMIEEGAKAELEQLRLAPIQNLIPIMLLTQFGVQPVPFNPEDAVYIATVVGKENVVPGWVSRLGYPGKNDEAVRIFNESVGPYVGLKIEADGSVVSTEVTKGPLAGQ